MNRIFKPAFGEQNRRVLAWIVISSLGYLAYFFFPYPANRILPDPTRRQAIADAKLRNVAMTRMREACFTDDQIKHYWYEQGFWEHTNRLLVVIRGRESLCGGRGLCGCEAKERPKGSV